MGAKHGCCWSSVGKDTLDVNQEMMPIHTSIWLQAREGDKKYIALNNSRSEENSTTEGARPISYVVVVVVIT